MSPGTLDEQVDACFRVTGGVGRSLKRHISDPAVANQDFQEELSQSEPSSRYSPRWGIMILRTTAPMTTFGIWCRVVLLASPATSRARLMPPLPLELSSRPSWERF